MRSRNSSGVMGRTRLPSGFSVEKGDGSEAFSIWAVAPASLGVRAKLVAAAAVRKKRRRDGTGAERLLGVGISGEVYRRGCAMSRKTNRDDLHADVDVREASAI